jgi:hypothetical protein
MIRPRYLRYQGEVTRGEIAGSDAVVPEAIRPILTDESTRLKYD